MRVGVVALQHESNTFVALPTTLVDFERDHLLVGEAVRTFMRDAHHEVAGFFEGLDACGVQSIPIFSARALPGGPLSAETFAQLLDALFTELRAAGKLDGLLVALHGAAVAVNHLDADGYVLQRLRKTVGDDLPIVCTLDPHANVSRAMVDACEAIIAYRTNPHVDQRDRGIEAARLLIRKLKGEAQPRQSAVFLPLVINIERQRTAEEPCLGVQRLCDELRRRPGVLSVSVTLGFPYADVPEMGSCVIVVMDARRGDPRPLASELARAIWDRKSEFIGVLIDCDEAIDRVADAPGPVLLLDMGDNVGGGSPGDGTALAHAIVRRQVPDALMTICDPESVCQATDAGVGQRLELRIGGKSDTRHGTPLDLEAEVIGLHKGRFRESQLRHGGWAEFDMGRIAILQAANRFTLMLTSQRLFPVSAGQWTTFGIDPSHYRIIVAKGVHAPVAAYEQICTQIIRVHTPGVTTADLESLQYLHRRRPLFPFERFGAGLAL